MPGKSRHGGFELMGHPRTHLLLLMLCMTFWATRDASSDLISCSSQRDGGVIKSGAFAAVAAIRHQAMKACEVPLVFFQDLFVSGRPTSASATALSLFVLTAFDKKYHLGWKGWLGHFSMSVVTSQLLVTAVSQCVSQFLVPESDKKNDDKPKYRAIAIKSVPLFVAAAELCWTIATAAMLTETSGDCHHTYNEMLMGAGIGCALLTLLQFAGNWLNIEERMAACSDTAKGWAATVYNSAFGSA